MDKFENLEIAIEKANAMMFKIDMPTEILSRTESERNFDEDQLVKRWKASEMSRKIIVDYLKTKAALNLLELGEVFALARGTETFQGLVQQSGFLVTILATTVSREHYDTGPSLKSLALN